MKDEIKEFEEFRKDEDGTYFYYIDKDGNEQWSYKLDNLKDYITNLQEKNESLKVKLNCKEYFSSTMPENTEFVILTKENYDRQQKDIELELIDYKSRNEKAKSLTNRTIEIIKQQPSGNDEWILERLNGINYCLGGDEEC